MKLITIFADAAVEPINPGGMGSCAFIAFEGAVLGSKGAPRPEPLHQQYGLIGRNPQMTNNSAEYRSIIAALKWCLREQFSCPVELYTDSQLVVRQVVGDWNCRAEHLIPLRDEAMELLAKMPNVRLGWVRREDNDVADALTRRAYEESNIADALAGGFRRRKS